MTGQGARRRSCAFLLGIAAAAALLVAAPAASAGGLVHARRGRGGDPYFPLDGNGGYDTKHYLVKVKYDPATDELEGKVLIRARATQNLSRFNLDLEGLTVDSIRVNGWSATWARDGGELEITPRFGIRKHHWFWTSIRYHGIPETIEDLFGISGFIHTDDGALVIGEPHVADTWYPVNDHPSDKASYTFLVTVPEGLEAVSNGELERTLDAERLDDLDSGTRTNRWPRT